MKTRYLLTIPIVLSCITTTVHARSCTNSEYDKAEYLAEKAGKKIVDGYGGGQDIRVRLTDCNYNGYSEKFKLDIEVYWNGSLFRSNDYNVDGELSFNSDGSDSKFSRTYANPNVRDLAFLGNIAAGAILLGALGDASSGSSSSSSSSNGYRLYFHNKCDEDVRLLIHYNDYDDGWKTDGWWTFNAYEKAYLSDVGGDLRTNDINLYFYAQTTDGYSGEWGGEYEYEYEGETYNMAKIVDKQGDTKWAIICD